MSTEKFAHFHFTWTAFGAKGTTPTVDIALLSAQAWGFPQSCWDLRGLGKTCHLLRVWAISWLRLGVLGLSLQLLSLEGVAGLETLWWTHSSPRPQNTAPFLELFQCRAGYGLCGPKSSSISGIVRDMCLLLLFFYIDKKSYRLGTDADLDSIDRTMPVKATPRGKLHSSSTVCKMKLASLPTTEGRFWHHTVVKQLLNVSRNSLCGGIHLNTDPLG